MANTAEEAVLVAALNDDRAEVHRRLRQFLPNERAALERACVLIEVCSLTIGDDEAGGGGPNDPD